MSMIDIMEDAIKRGAAEAKRLDELNAQRAKYYNKLLPMIENIKLYADRPQPDAFRIIRICNEMEDFIRNQK